MMSQLQSKDINVIFIQFITLLDLMGDKASKRITKSLIKYAI